MTPEEINQRIREAYIWGHLDSSSHIYRRPWFWRLVQKQREVEAWSDWKRVMHHVLFTPQQPEEE